MYGRFDIDNMSLEDLEKVMDECADNVVNGTEEERLGANHNTPAHSGYLCRLQKKG